MKCPVRWTLRDLLWLTIAIGLLATLLMKSPAWNQALLDRVVLPDIQDSVVKLYPLQASGSHESDIVLVGRNVAPDVELHRFTDVSSDASDSSLIERFRLPTGRYAITWWREEETASTRLCCASNGKMIHASLNPADLVLRESSRTGLGASLFQGEAESPWSIVEDRDGDNRQRVQLVLRCVADSEP